MLSFVRKHPVLTFFVLAYGLSWAYWIPLDIAGVRVGPGSRSTHFPGLLGPALAAFIVSGVTDGKRGIVALVHRVVLVSRPIWRFWFYALSPLLFLMLRCSRQWPRRSRYRRAPTSRCTRVCRRGAFLLSCCSPCCSMVSAKKRVGAVSRLCHCSVGSDQLAARRARLVVGRLAHTHVLRG